MTLLAYRISQSAFSPTAWQVIKKARNAANECRAVRIGTEHILASISQSDTLEGEAMRKCGVTYEAIMSHCTVHTTPDVKPKTFNEETLENNFDSSAKRALDLTTLIAQRRQKEEADVAELLEVISGFHTDGYLSKRILATLGITSGTLQKTIRLVAQSSI